jgi:hypothetical protein
VKRLIVSTMLALGLLLVLLAAPALASVQTFSVHPSGGNDTQAIKKAFDRAVKAGPGSVVQLSAGTFYMNNILVKNFNGTVKGVGEGKTTIDCLRGLNASKPGITLMPGQNYTFLLGFSGGHVKASDLSFDLTAFSPVDADSNGGSDILQSTVWVTDDASASFERVGFRAGPGNDSGFDCDEGIVFTGAGPADANGNALTFRSISGTESVCDCSFVGHDGVQSNGLIHGSLTISGSVFDSVGLGCVIDDSSASQVTICHNEMTNNSGVCVVLYQGLMASGNGDATLLPPLPAPRCLISGNNLVATGDANAIFSEDDSLAYGASNRLSATIAGNTIDLAGDGAGIGEYATRDFCVFNNRISGTAWAGISPGDDYGGPDGTTLFPVSGWKIVGNDVSHLTTSSASIYLGHGTTHCLVVGGPPPTTVLNYGTDNTLINVTQILDPLARATAMTPPGQMGLRKTMAVR